MFKVGLLTSTAMTAVALLLSGAPAGAYAQTDMHVASRDPNARFLCTYGHFFVSAFSSNLNSGSLSGSAWHDVAVPITGHGQTVRRIRVIEAKSGYTANSAFSAGIYRNSPSGPGNLIAKGTGIAGGTCGAVTISITPTILKPHTTYWIEETTSTPRCHRLSQSTCVSHVGLYWEADPKTKRKAYMKYHYRSGSSGRVSSYTSPWTEQSMGPYFKLK